MQTKLVMVLSQVFYDIWALENALDLVDND